MLTDQTNRSECSFTSDWEYSAVSGSFISERTTPGPDSNIWAVDVAPHKVLTFTPQGRIVQVIGRAGTQPGGMDSQDGFNRPAGIAFTREGDYCVSDG